MRSFVVIGCGRFGASLAKTLYELGNEVMVIDSSEDRIAEISNSVTHAVQADIMDENLLFDLGLSNFDVAVIAIGSILEASVMATLAAKELGIKKVVAKAQSDMHSKLLLKIGADKVVFPEQDMGARVAHNLNSTNILDFVDFSSEYGLVELVAFNDWKGKTLADLEIPSKYKVSVIAIRRGEDLILPPTSSESIKDGDIVVIIGRSKDVKKLENIKG